MVQFLSIDFFFWISSIFVGFFKSSRFFVSPCTCTSSWNLSKSRGRKNNRRTLLKGTLLLSCSLCQNIRNRHVTYQTWFGAHMSSTSWSHLQSVLVPGSRYKSRYLVRTISCSIMDRKESLLGSNNIYLYLKALASTVLVSFTCFLFSLSHHAFLHSCPSFPFYCYCFLVVPSLYISLVSYSFSYLL